MSRETAGRRERAGTLTEGAVGKRLFFFALPMMLGSVFQQFYTFADTMIVGKELGMTALAALGGTEWLTFLAFSAVQGMTGGFGTLIARHFGAGDDKKMKAAVWNAGVLCAVLAVLGLTAGQLCAGALLQAIQTPAEVRKMAEVYLRWLYGGIPVTFAYHMEAAILRAWGDSKTPFAATAVSGVMNIFLDVCFVILLGWGIAGAAFATVLAQLFSAVWCMAAILRRRENGNRAPVGVIGNGVHRIWEPGQLDFSMAKEQVKLGTLLALQGMITGFGGAVVQSVINSFGVSFVAGYTAANKLYGLLETAASSYGQATVSFVSQNLGARRFDRIRKGICSAAGMGCITALLMSCVMLLAGENILLCFLSGEKEMLREPLEIGLAFLRILSVFFPLLYLLYILRAAVQGMGNGTVPMLSSGVQLAMRIFCALLLTRRIGYTGIFWGEIGAWLEADLLLLAFAMKYFTKTALPEES